MKLARLSRRFRTSPMRLGAHPGALLQIRMCAEAALPMETGGILIGYRTVRAIVVTEIAEVPDPNATARTYNRDQRVAQQLLDERLACEPQSSALGYVGEWHSHLCDLTASPTDGSTLRRNALADGDSIALIVTRRTTQGWDESGYSEQQALAAMEADRVGEAASGANRGLRRGECRKCEARHDRPSGAIRVKKANFGVLDL